ncbi:hypothetical protein QCA50_016645 [Cerrena zonata]|uniref:F-box domain-containing protein n=1 Tax=Cerrena zonata TaxID=2478898 RepID=A0AAW0FN12_9APHY
MNFEINTTSQVLLQHPEHWSQDMTLATVADSYLPRRPGPWGHENAYLPIELCETIIDCLVAESFDREIMKTLSACISVCRAWQHRSRYNLACNFICRGAKLFHEPFGKRDRPFLLRGYVPPLVHFLIATSYVPRLRCLAVKELNMSEEHPSLLKVTPSTSIKSLELNHCKTQSMAQLGRFIMSFPSLSELNISWSTSLSGLRNTHLRRNTSRCSLQRLNIELVPNVSALLGYLVRAKPSVTYLQVLQLQWDYIENVERRCSLFRGIKELIYHCGLSLEELYVSVRGHVSGLITDDLLDLDLIPLSPLVNLKVFEYSCFSNPGNIALYARCALTTLPTKNKLRNVIIRQYDEFGEEAGIIDDLLASTRFRSLHNLYVLHKRQIYSFPLLQARGVPVCV